MFLETILSIQKSFVLGAIDLSELNLTEIKGGRKERRGTEKILRWGGKKIE